MNTLHTLYPAQLWQSFAHICSIPHISKHESALAKSIVQMADKEGHAAQIDEAGNVIVRVAASPGRESRPILALQAHIDMVPQKNSATVHDFDKDPITPRIDGDWVYATGTTLGADNGIGASAMIAVMQRPELLHGPLELLFTVDEEAGMGGAFGLKSGVLTAEYLLNLDSEDDRDITIGCAGGIDANVVAQIAQKPTSVLEPVLLKISLTGLKGGHSGIDIHLGRANANILMSRLMIDLLEHSSVELVHFHGGNMRNAIPREAFAEIVFGKINLEKIIAKIGQWEQEFKVQYAATDPQLSLTCRIAEYSDSVQCFAKADVMDFFSSIATVPNGVIEYEADFPEVVKTSSNLSIAVLDSSGMKICLLLRSSSEDAKVDLVIDIRDHFEEFAFTADVGGSYPGWAPDAGSAVLAKLTQVYSSVMASDPHIQIIHAGLECGIIGSKYPDMQMVSFGPTIKHPHSPDECVSISSVGKFWNILVAFMAAV